MGAAADWVISRVGVVGAWALSKAGVVGAVASAGGALSGAANDVWAGVAAAAIASALADTGVPLLWPTLKCSVRCSGGAVGVCEVPIALPVVGAVAAKRVALLGAALRSEVEGTARDDAFVSSAPPTPGVGLESATGPVGGAELLLAWLAVCTELSIGGLGRDPAFDKLGVITEFSTDGVETDGVEADVCRTDPLRAGAWLSWGSPGFD